MIDTDKYEGHTEGPWIWNHSIFSSPHPHHPSWMLKSGEEILVSKADGKGLRGPTYKLIKDAPLLLAEVKRLREWIYHHANNLDAGGVHRMGTSQPLSTFADEAREAIGVKRGEVIE